MNNPILDFSIQTILRNIEKTGYHTQQLLSPDYFKALTLDLDKHQLKLAQVGGNQQILNTAIRNDSISWIEDSNVATLPYIEFLNYLRTAVNAQFYFNLKRHEIHYAQYDPGNFYKKHLDSSQNNNTRKITVISYLNQNWEPEFGGALKLYLADETKTLYPQGGTCVIFLSEEIPHEVMPSTKTRKSITGWLHN